MTDRSTPSSAAYLTDQQRDLLDWLRGAGAVGAQVGALDHRPVTRLVELGLVDRVEGRWYRAKPAIGEV